MQTKKPFKIPSKTFLLGEYAVLQAGDAFVLTFPNCFSFSLGESTDSFHSESAAGKLLATNNTGIHFERPNNGLGGFGASTAEFIAACKFKNLENPWNMRTKLQELSAGTKPSGVDLVAQFFGSTEKSEIHFIAPSSEGHSLVKLDFGSHTLALIHTGQKLATHEHLANNFSDKNFVPLKKIVSKARSLTKLRDFAHAMNEYWRAMNQLNLAAEHTNEIISTMAKHFTLIGAKGCGAMGADVIAIVTPKTEKTKIQTFCSSHKLQLVSFIEALT